MINCFLGTLIGVERAAALNKRWSYIGPICFAASTVFLLSGLMLWCKIFLVLGSFFLLLVLSYLYKLQAETYHLIMALGGASLVMGNILYLWGYPIFQLVAWWIGFPVLTIFGERLELNRIMRPPQKAQNVFTILIVVWIAGVAFTYVHRYAGWAVASVALISLSLWLFKYDIARRTIKAKEWTRYSAICLLSGYGWLIFVGLFGLWKGLPYAGNMYDALLHAIFVGFVFSMIFAHSSVIIPSLTGRMIPYSKYFYIPLVLLHLSLVMRIIGDLQWNMFIRKSGAHSNVLAILLFLVGVITQLVRASRKEKNPRYHE